MQSRRLAVVLLSIVAARFIFHALYVPAFEGPDEPFHLARTYGGRMVDGEIAGAIKAHPCAADLRRVFACPPFGAKPAEFNELSHGPTAAAAPVANYEAHQPPLYYLGGSIAPREPLSRLLWMRMFSVLLVIVSAWISPAPALLALLVPGAAESLARCANDAGVFAWCAAVIWAVRRERSTSLLTALAIIGPLIKLTAIVPIAFLIAWLLQHRGWRHALIATLGAAAVVPVQLMRGYGWGGTVELNAAAAVHHDTAREWLIGFARSAYTFVKTAFWLGEWSFFRAPVWLVVLTAAFAIVLILSARWQAVRAHIVALLVGIVTICTWFIVHRTYWGTWGGVGGWYVWGWFPWIAAALEDSAALQPRRRKALFIAAAVIVAIANAAWFAAAHAIYG